MLLSKHLFRRGLKFPCRLHALAGFARPTPKTWPAAGASADGGLKTEAPVVIAATELNEVLPDSSGSDSAGFVQAAMHMNFTSRRPQLNVLTHLKPHHACFAELMALDSCDSPPDKSPSMLLEVFQATRGFKEVSKSGVSWMQA